MNLFGLSQSQLSHAVARVMAAEPPASQARSRSPRRLQPPPAMAFSDPTELPPPGLAPVAAVVAANLPADALPEGPLNSLEFLSSPRGTDELKRQLNTFLAEARAGKEAWEARFANMALDDPARYELGVFTYCYPCSQLVGLGHLEREWPMFCAGRCEFHQLLEKVDNRLRRLHGSNPERLHATERLRSVYYVLDCSAAMPDPSNSWSLDR